MSENFYLFLDESGCLGFNFEKPGTSGYFTISALLVRQTSLNQIKIAVKRTLKNKVNVKRKNRVAELKGTNTTLSVKRYFYSQMPEHGWRIFSIYIDKSNAYDNLRTKNGKKRLYNYLSRVLISKIVRFLKEKDFEAHTISIVVDRSKDGSDMKDFNQYIKTHIESQMPIETRIYIDHQSSQEHYGLQAVDLFCYGCQLQKVNPNDEWYKVFKEKLEETKHF